MNYFVIGMSLFIAIPIIGIIIYIWKNVIDVDNGHIDEVHGILKAFEIEEDVKDETYFSP